MAKSRGTMTASEAAEALRERNPSLHGKVHHATIKKTWAEWRIATNAVRRKRAPADLGGDFLRAVREALDAPRPEAEPGAAADEVAVTAAAKDAGRAKRLGFDDAAVAKARAEVDQLGDRASDWAKLGATAADGIEGGNDLGPATCSKCQGDGIQVIKRVDDAGVERDDGVYCECPMGARRRVEDKAAEISGIEAGPEGLVGEESAMAMAATMKRSKKVTRSSAKGDRDLEAARELKKKYAKVKEIVEWTDKGKPSKVVIRCAKVSSECEKERAVKVQDLFQVHRCPPCQAQFLKNRRAEARAEK
jgi:hypothetical protein